MMEPVTPRILITMGDPAGIGPEVVVKALTQVDTATEAQLEVVGDLDRLAQAARLCGVPVPDVQVHQVGTLPPDLAWGRLDARAGEAAYQYVAEAARLVLAGAAEAICTAPINKEALRLAGHAFPGHTELLAHLTGTAEVSMMLTAPGLRVVHVTTHVGLLDAVALIEPGGGAPDEADDDGDSLAAAADPLPSSASSPADHVVLETNIDDMSPELLAHATDVLRDAGALDVWLTPALMKKGRPGNVLHVLACAVDRERLAGIVFAETTSFGLRVLPVARMYAEERRETVRIAGHDVGVRLAFVDGRLATVSPEYEDCRRAAAELGRPARVVYEAAQARARSRFSGA